MEIVELYEYFHLRFDKRLYDPEYILPESKLYDYNGIEVNNKDGLAYRIGTTWFQLLGADNYLPSYDLSKFIVTENHLLDLCLLQDDNISMLIDPSMFEEWSINRNTYIKLGGVCKLTETLYSDNSDVRDILSVRETGFNNFTTNIDFFNRSSKRLGCVHDLLEYGKIYELGDESIYLYFMDKEDEFYVMDQELMALYVSLVRNSPRHLLSTYHVPLHLGKGYRDKDGELYLNKILLPC